MCMVIDVRTVVLYEEQKFMYFRKWLLLLIAM